MNAARRSRIEAALATLQECRDEEEQALGNLPDSIQASERGDAMQAAVDALDNAISELEQITNA